MYAIIEIGSHQYRVEPGSDITVFSRDTDEGETLTIDDVLMVREEDDTHIGEPYVDGAKVETTVEEHFRGEKITVFNYKQRYGRRRKLGHRDELTRLSIDDVSLNS